MARRSGMGDLGVPESTATNTDITIMTARKDEHYERMSLSGVLMHRKKA